MTVVQRGPGSRCCGVQPDGDRGWGWGCGQGWGRGQGWAPGRAPCPALLCAASQGSATSPRPLGCSQPVLFPLARGSARLTSLRCHRPGARLSHPARSQDPARGGRADYLILEPALPSAHLTWFAWLDAASRECRAVPFPLHLCIRAVQEPHHNLALGLWRHPSVHAGRPSPRAGVVRGAQVHRGAWWDRSPRLHQGLWGMSSSHPLQSCPGLWENMAPWPQGSGEGEPGASRELGAEHCAGLLRGPLGLEGEWPWWARGAAGVLAAARGCWWPWVLLPGFFQFLTARGDGGENPPQPGVCSPISRLASPWQRVVPSSRTPPGGWDPPGPQPVVQDGFSWSSLFPRGSARGLWGGHGIRLVC